VLSARPGRVVETLTVDLPRPRQRMMIADPAFGRGMAALLRALGVPV
jgi:hypothetical protein